MQLLFNQLLKVRLTEKVFHHIQTVVDGLLIFQRENHPAFQQTGPHRADCPVDHIEQTAAAIIHTADQLEAADSKLIQTHILIFLDTGQRSDMPDLCMLCHRQILQDSAGSDNTILQMLHPEAFQVFGLKVLQQFLAGSSFSKDPVIQFESKELAAEVTFEHQAFAPFKKNLFRSEIIQQFVYIVEGTFRSEKLTGRYIQKSNSTGSLSEVNGSQEVIFFIIQYIVIDRDTGSNQFGDTSFHQFLRQFRVFQLVADSYTLSGTNQLRKICIERMMGKSCHFNGLSFPISAFCQCNS